MINANLKNKIINGDSIKELKKIPDESFDLIFSDPPYNLQLRNQLLRPDRSKVDAVNDKWDQFGSFKVYDNFTLNWLKECKRVCKTNAKVVLIEHLRDLPNFLAFSIGFTHFFSKNTWVSDFNKAGFTLDNSLKFTRFMSILTFKK